MFGHPSVDATIPPIIQNAIEKSDGEKWARIKPYLSCSKKEPEPPTVIETCEATMATAQKAITFYETMHERITGDPTSFSLPETCSEARKIVDDAMAFGEFSQAQSNTESNKSNESNESSESNEPKRRGLKKKVPYPFRSHLEDTKFNNPLIHDTKYNHGLVLTTAQGCTASEKAKLEMWGHDGVRIVECVNADGRPIRSSHPDAHYCTNIKTYPTFKTVDNQLYPYPY